MINPLRLFGISCKFNLHTWVNRKGYQKWIADRTCRHCGKCQYLVYDSIKDSIMYVDYPEGFVEQTHTAPRTPKINLMDGL